MMLKKVWKSKEIFLKEKRKLFWFPKNVFCKWLLHSPITNHIRALLQKLQTPEQFVRKKAQKQMEIETFLKEARTKQSTYLKIENVSENRNWFHVKADKESNSQTRFEKASLFLQILENWSPNYSDSKFSQIIYQECFGASEVNKTLCWTFEKAWTRILCRCCIILHHTSIVWTLCILKHT